MISPCSRALAAVCAVCVLMTHSWTAGAFGGETPPDSESSTHAPTVEWQKDYSNEDRTDEHPCLIRAEDGGTYVVGISNRRTGETQFHYQLWIWKLNARGERVWARTPKIPGLPESESIIWSSCVCPEGERVIVAQESLPKTGVWLLRFDSAGDVTSCKALPLGRIPHVIRTIRQIPGGFLLSGARLDSKNDAWVLKVDEDGKEVWQKTYDRGQSEAAISLDAAPDGSFAFAADSGEYNKFGGGPSNVWVVRCDEAGKILAETMFQGRHPTISRSSDGYYAVSMNTEDFPALRMQILGLDEKLQKIWGPHEIAKGAGLGMYKIQADDRGNFIFAGSAMSALFLGKFTRSGEAAWVVPIPSEVHCTLVNSFSIDEDGYLLAAAGKDGSQDRPSDSTPVDPNGHRDQFDILVVKLRPPGDAP